MRNATLHSDLQRLRSLIDRTDRATTDIELQGHWGRYLCVLVAGFIENSIEVIYSDFARNSSSLRIQSFVSSRLRRISNPKAEIILQTAGAFDLSWQQELREFINADQGQLKDAIDSIMANRNDISHGKPTNISVSRVKDYLDRCVKVIEFIENQCDI